MTKGNTNGLSLIELIVTLAILSVLASVIMPSAQMIAKRTKEIELRRNLRTIRTAIDEYYKANREALSKNKTNLLPPGENLQASGYPKTLQDLVEGVDLEKGPVEKKMKFLRRVPIDPFNPPNPGEPPKWGMRSYTDAFDSTTWGEEDVFDVYSQSEETAIDGTKYNEW